MEAFGRFWTVQVNPLAIYGIYRWAPGPFSAEIGAKWTNFAFDPVLLIKNMILIHFLDELIYESFWEILSFPSHSFGDLWGL